MQNKKKMLLVASKTVCKQSLKFTKSLNLINPTLQTQGWNAPPKNLSKHRVNLESEANLKTHIMDIYITGWKAKSKRYFPIKR